MRIVLFFLMFAFISAPLCAAEAEHQLNRNFFSFKSLTHPIKFLQESKAAPLKKARPEYSDYAELLARAYDAGLDLRALSNKDHTLYGALHLNEQESAPKQIGRAARIMHNHSGESTEEFQLQLFNKGVKGPSIALIRKDFEQALLENRGSAEEIWRNTEISDTNKHYKRKIAIDHHELNPIHSFLIPKLLKLEIKNQSSLATGERTVLNRTSAVLSLNSTYYRGDKRLKHKDSKSNILFKDVAFHRSLGIKANLFSNLDRMRTDIRRPAYNPIRGDIDVFAEQKFLLDNASAAVSWHGQNINALASVGYLDEQFFGYHLDILYRPYKPNYALGFDAFYGAKRDPLTFMATSIGADESWSAHVKAYYDFPAYNTQIGIRAGRYLGRDIGSTVNLTKTFQNGIQLGGFATYTNRRDFDNFGDRNNFEAGIRFTMPLAQIIKPIKGNVQLRAEYKPFGRDTGQFIEPPISLMEITDKIDRPHIENHWDEILD